jgi:acetyl esterase/lipase
MRVVAADPTPRYGTALLGVPYAEKSGRTLSVQLLLPPMESESSDLFPCLLYVQGSAWLEQELGASLPALAEFARRGYVIAIVQYRPSTVAPFPAQVKDAKSAVRFLRGRATEFHIDADRMAMWGDSSGGHTTVLACLTQDDPSYSDEPDNEPLGLRCFIDFYGPTDISRMNEEPSTMDHCGPSSPEGMLIGGHHVLEHPALASPTIAMNHVPADRSLQPMLIMHGSQDRLVPFAQSVLLYKALTAAGQPVDFYQLHGSDHGGPPFWQPNVMDIVDSFLCRHLGGPT